jgi:hypothetical protein
MRIFQNHKSTTMETRPSSEDPEFVRSNEEFALPSDMVSLDRVRKRQVTICNLFCNQHQSIADIVRVLDETYAHVVCTLLENRLVLDRRQQNRAARGADRRRPRANQQTHKNC